MAGRHKKTLAIQWGENNLTISQLARELGVHRNTIGNRLKNDPDFRAAFEYRNRETVERKQKADLIAKINEALFTLSVDSLDRLLTDLTTSPAHSGRAIK